MAEWEQIQGANNKWQNESRYKEQITNDRMRVDTRSK